MQMIAQRRVQISSVVLEVDLEGDARKVGNLVVDTVRTLH